MHESRRQSIKLEVYTSKVVQVIPSLSIQISSSRKAHIQVPPPRERMLDTIHYNHLTMKTKVFCSGQVRSSEEHAPDRVFTGLELPL